MTPHVPESLRARMHHLLTREEGGRGGQAVRAGLVLLIVFSVGTAILKSVPQFSREHFRLFDAISRRRATPAGA